MRNNKLGYKEQFRRMRELSEEFRQTWHSVNTETKIAACFLLPFAFLVGGIKGIIITIGSYIWQRD